MSMEIGYVMLVPLLGTCLGSACVFFLKKDLDTQIQKILNGFAAGVMIAASIWSLLIPAIEQSKSMGRWSFLPPMIGFWMGILFLLLLDRLIPYICRRNRKENGIKAKPQKTYMMVAAVTLHNIPEGMAVGVVGAGFLTGNGMISSMGILILTMGIAIQNFPEGTIVSMPLRAEGMTKIKAFLGGVLSGAVEPAGAAAAILAAGLVAPALPYFLGFAAGAMICVVVEELMPEISTESHSNIGTIFFAVGFSVMMILDVALS